MARFRASFGRILTIGGLAAATSSIAAYQYVSERASARAPILDNASIDDVLKPKTQWDPDWDRRKFGDLKKKISAKNLRTIDENTNYEKNTQKMADENINGVDSNETDKQPKATRHLIFVRHGQYNYGKTDEDRTLTDIGR